LAAAEPKQATKDFKVSFFADEVYVLSLLGVWFLIFAVCLIGFWGFGWTYRHTTLGLVIGLFSAVLGFVSVQMLAYILVLCFRAGVIFSLDRRGLRDYASFSQVGYILLKDIRKVVIKGTVLGDFVLVYLRPDSKGMKKKTLFQKALSWWVAWISPDAIVIPMG
jgi:predicted membrane protein